MTSSHLLSSVHGLRPRDIDVHITADTGFSQMIAAEGLTHHPLPLDFQEIIQDPEMQSAITTFAGEHKAFSLASEIINKQFSAKWSIGLYALSEKVAMKAKEDGAGTITAMVNQIERSATKFA